jgi:hypothetical protein
MSRNVWVYTKSNRDMMVIATAEAMESKTGRVACAALIIVGPLFPVPWVVVEVELLPGVT